MKPFKNFLRYWLAVTSVLTFVGGWIILAHSPKPVQPNKNSSSLAPLPGLPSIQQFGNSNNNNGSGLFSPLLPNNSQSGSGFGFPTLRTGGS